MLSSKCSGKSCKKLNSNQVLINQDKRVIQNFDGKHYVFVGVVGVGSIRILWVVGFHKNVML